MKLRFLCHALVPVFLSALAVSASPPARAQGQTPAAGSIAQVRDRFHAALKESAGKAGMRLHGETGAVDAGLEAMVRDTIFRLQVYADSMAATVGRRLSSTQLDSIGKAKGRFAATARSMRSVHGRALQVLLEQFLRRLETARIARADCPDCTKPEDFRYQLSAFTEDANALAEALADTAIEVRDSLQDALSDSADAYRSVLEDMKDRYADDDIETADFSAAQRSALIGSVRYTSHFAYRGRDNGEPTYALIPSATYRHSSGLSVNLTRYWLAKAFNQWNETDLGAEYDFDLTDDLSAYLGYTRFWFADSSDLSRSIFTNSAGGGISWSNSPVTLEADLNEDFGTRSQFTAILSVSLSWTIIRRSGLSLDFQPGIAAAYGQQLFQSIPEVGTTDLVLRDASFFGIIDYEFVLPFRLTLGPMALALSLLYDFPVNVLDESTSAPFFSAAATMSVTVR